MSPIRRLGPVARIVLSAVAMGALAAGAGATIAIAQPPVFSASVIVQVGGFETSAAELAERQAHLLAGAISSGGAGAGALDRLDAQHRPVEPDLTAFSTPGTPFVTVIVNASDETSALALARTVASKLGEGLPSAVDGTAESELLDDYSDAKAR